MIVLVWVAWGKSQAYRLQKQAKQIKHQQEILKATIESNLALLQAIEIAYEEIQDLFGAIPYQMKVRAMRVEFAISKEPANEDFELTYDAENWEYEEHLEKMIIWTIIHKLNGRCAYREVLAALEPYNNAVKKLGLNKLKISENRVRNLLKQYEFDPLIAWPVIQIINQDNPQWNQKIINNYVILPATSRGGTTRAIVPLKDVFNAEKPFVSVVKGAVSVETMTVSAAYQAINANH